MMKEHKPPKRWQDDEGFVDFMKRSKYLGCLSLGVTIYMWESWCAGRKIICESSSLASEHEDNL